MLGSWVTKEYHTFRNFVTIQISYDNDARVSFFCFPCCHCSSNNTTNSSDIIRGGSSSSFVWIDCILYNMVYLVKGYCIYLQLKQVYLLDYKSWLQLIVHSTNNMRGKVFERSKMVTRVHLSACPRGIITIRPLRVVGRRKTTPAATMSVQTYLRRIKPQWVREMERWNWTITRRRVPRPISPVAKLATNPRKSGNWRPNQKTLTRSNGSRITGWRRSVLSKIGCWSSIVVTITMERKIAQSVSRAPISNRWPPTGTILRVQFEKGCRERSYGSTNKRLWVLATQ